MQVGIRELKATLSAVLQRVKAGEEVVVTERGTPVARLQRMAPTYPPPQAARLVAQGRLSYKPPARTFPEPLDWSPGEKTAADYVRDQRR